MQTKTINRPKVILNPEVLLPDQGVKRVLVKFSGGMMPPKEAVVGPGTTAQELLYHLGLSADDYNLSMGSGNSVFGLDESIYPMINDGSLLFVTSRVDAGYWRE